MGIGFIIVLRVDFDVLFVEELNDVFYKFKNLGCMYVCGYDGYIVILFIVVEILDEYKYLLEGNVVLIF